MGNSRKGCRHYRYILLPLRKLYIPASSMAATFKTRVSHADATVIQHDVPCDGPTRYFRQHCRQQQIAFIICLSDVNAVCLSAISDEYMAARLLTTSHFGSRMSWLLNRCLNCQAA